MAGIVFSGVLGAFFALIPSIASIAADGIPKDQFEKLHTLIKPKPSESKWEQIPWLVSLWEARERAAAAGKPILLW